AVQAISDEGTVKIRVFRVDQTRSGGEEDAGLSIRIEDSGCGIPKNQMEDVFKPFFTTRREGTGLGLAISRKLVLLHNGFIEFDPAVLSGTAVNITIPIHYDPDRTLDLKFGRPVSEPESSD
ncbi:hypothetical protein JW979_13910, partial [bacterium]|nr:hypothetical protein [candidate division CSSED10-310 bacterium]